MVNKRFLSLALASVFFSGCQTWHYQEVDKMPPSAALPQTSQLGIVEALYWNNVESNYLSTLVGLPTFPESPDQASQLTELRGETNRADNYGTLVRGYLIPPTDGAYRFFVSGDDQTEFWLSPTHSILEAERIAAAPGSTPLETYTTYASQASGLKELVAGKRYYFEIRHKEGLRGDHFSVAWEGPGIPRQIIGTAYIASLGQSLYPTDPESRTAYNLGYRIGYLDGAEDIPFNADYPPLDNDLDGLYDNWEILNGLDPAVPSDAESDLDGDFLVAADEFLIGTRENNSDTDNDGIADGDEFAYGLDPLDPVDAVTDSDGDGFSNLAEYEAGTSPTNSEDIPKTAPVYVTGFVGQYFQGTTFNSFIATRQDQSIDFSWGRGQILPSLPEDQVSIRWSGLFTAPHGSGARDYQFTTRTDDGARLYLNGQLVIDQWQDQGATSYSHLETLQAGETVTVSMEYYENLRGAVAQLFIVDNSTGIPIPSSSSVKTPHPDDSSLIDTDTDGVPDSWEIKYGLKPWRNDSESVMNSGGTTNLEAFQSGLNPWTLEPVPTTYEMPSSVEPTPDSDIQTENGSVTLTWSAPLTRLDGSSIALSEIDRYRVLYGQSPDTLNQTVIVDGAETSVEISGLETGTWYFAMQVIDINGLESPVSQVVEYKTQ